MSEKEKSIPVSQVYPDQTKSIDDVVVVEEPMEIRVVAGPESKRKSKGLSITMRTPGDDFELTAGFLFAEAIVIESKQIQQIEYCGKVADGESISNIVNVELQPETKFDFAKLQRHFYATSSCGICGKASLEAIRTHRFAALDDQFKVDRDLIFGLPDKLRREQKLFSTTGGIHAAGIFDATGQLLSIKEDVGRHNALDKLIGYGLLNDRLPFEDNILVVSGRASFELLQKSLAARIPVFVAVGAPSSLAIELAEEFGITLVGFTSQERFNIYTHSHRIA